MPGKTQGECYAALCTSESRSKKWGDFESRSKRIVTLRKSTGITKSMMGIVGKGVGIQVGN